MSDAKHEAGSKRRSRASLSSGPLSRPETPIHILVSRVQDYLYFPTPDHLYIVLGVMAANMLKGSPVWMVLIGAPSSGRTVMLETLADLPRVHIVGAIKSPSALLSGTSAGERGKLATGGLLPMIGDYGIMVMKDFTSMLSMPREPLAEAIGALREVFDGRYSRPLGTDGGKVLEWRGRIGFLAACTPALDRHAALIGDLGERWIYYRYPETDGYGETVKSLGIKDPAGMMQDLRELVRGFMDGTGLTWEPGGNERRDLTPQETNRLYAMGALVCAARSAVSRDPYHAYEVTDVAMKEAPPRMTTELGQLYLGLERIGLSAAECWRLVGKVALDSVRQVRVLVLMEVRRKKGVPVKAGELLKLVPCGRRTLDVTIGDLMIHGVLKKHGKVVTRTGEDEEGAGAGGYVLTDWARELLDLGWGRVR